MIKQFLIKNWVQVIVFGLMAFIYLDKSEESAKQEKLIDQVIRDQEEYKQNINKTVSSLTYRLDSLHGRHKILLEKSKELNTELKRIQNERTETNRNIYSYSDTRLDSILSNHRHK